MNKAARPVPRRVHPADRRVVPAVIAAALFLPAAGLAAPLAPQPALPLTATVAPSPFIPVGGTADVRVSLPTAASLADVHVTLSSAGGNIQVSEATPEELSQGIVAVLQAGASAGSASVTVSSPGTTAVTLPVAVYAHAADLLSGKGAWASFNTYSALGAQAILERSAAEGVTHLYLETTGVNFVGERQLDTILQQAHNLGIAVIAWDYAALRNVPAEVRSARATLAYTTALGARVDGLAGDFEGNLSAAAMRTFSAAVRQSAGPSRAYVGIIYAPQFGFPTPIATMARYVDVFAPMDYWLGAPRFDTVARARSFVTTSIRQLRQTPGEGGVPIEVISQTQDIIDASGFGPYNPPPAQVVASAQAAVASGAIGVSFYDLRTQTQAQIAAIQSLSVPSTLN
jgi:hypothetical protein